MCISHSDVDAIQLLCTRKTYTAHSMKQIEARDTKPSSITRKNYFKTVTETSTLNCDNATGGEGIPTNQCCSNRCDLISMTQYLSHRGINTFKKTSNDNSNTVMQRLTVPVRRLQRQNQQQMHHCEQKLHQLQAPAVPKHSFEFITNQLRITAHRS